MASVRTFAFGTPERWGAGFFPGEPGEPGVLVLGGAVLSGRLEGSGADAVWQVTAEGVALTITGAGAPAAVPGHDAAESHNGFEQRCTVSGAAGARGAGVSAPGLRGERLEAGPLADADSVRAVQAWFAEEVGAGLLAVRPRKAKAHNADVASAAVLSPDEALPITDARLSTTYTGSGRPARVNLELWSDDPDAYPRRVAGEAANTGVQGTAAGWAITAELLAAHLRGEEGTGVYLLGRRA